MPTKGLFEVHERYSLGRKREWRDRFFDYLIKMLQGIREVEYSKKPKIDFKTAVRSVK